MSILCRLLIMSAAYIQMHYRIFTMSSDSLTSAAYVQVHSRLDFIMEANNVNHDQTAPDGAV